MSGATARAHGGNHTHGHTSRHRHSSSANWSTSSDSFLSVTLPTSQAASSAVSQSTPVQSVSHGAATVLYQGRIESVGREGMQL